MSICISTLLKKIQEKLIKLLHEYKYLFAWDYEKMFDLDRNFVKHPVYIARVKNQ